MTECAEHATRILVCRSGVYDDAIVTAFAGQSGIQLELVVGKDVARRLGDAHGLLIRNSDYDGRIGEAVQTASNLRWIQFLSSGTDRLDENGGAPPTVRVTNCAAALGRAVAEHAMALLLGLLRGIHIAERDRAVARWQRAEFRDELASLEGARIAIVGYGAIGRQVAKLASAFGAEIMVVRRSTRTADVPYPVLPLAAATRQAEAIVIAIPLTQESYHLFDEHQLANVLPHCRLVNVSRGGIIATDALVEALREGRLHSAGLDVFEEEPLPPNSPLWHLPNVILTPHVGGDGQPNTAIHIANTCVRNYIDIMKTAPTSETH